MSEKYQSKVLNELDHLCLKDKALFVLMLYEMRPTWLLSPDGFALFEYCQEVLRG